MKRILSAIAIAVTTALATAGDSLAYTQIPQDLVSETGKSYMVYDHNDDGHEYYNGYATDPQTGKRYGRGFMFVEALETRNSNGWVNHGLMVESGHGERCVAAATMYTGNSGDNKLIVTYIDNPKNVNCTVVGDTFTTTMYAR